MRVLSIIGLLICLISCSSGNGGGGSRGEPPADVSGSWDVVAMNSGVATFVSCSGDFVVVNGMTVAEVEAAGPTCTTTDPMVVSQVDDIFTCSVQQFTCDDASSFSFAGGGAVTADTLKGQLDTVHSEGFTGKELFNRLVDDLSHLTFYEYRLESTGSMNGACNLNPELESRVTISPAPLRDARTGNRSPSRLVADYLRSLQN